jgi:hypothetical protein
MVSSDRLLRLHGRRVSPVRHPGRRRRSRCSRRSRLSRRSAQKSHPRVDGRAGHRVDRHDPHRCVAVNQQRRPARGLLHDAGESHAVRRIVESHLDECGGVYQEDDDRGALFDWVLCWKYHWYVSPLLSFLYTILTLSNTGPQTFRPSDAPRYTPAEITIIVCWGACLVDLAFIYWYFKRQNAKKVATRAEPGYEKLVNQEWLDLTDKENLEFMYSL